MFVKSYWMFIAGLLLLFAVAVYARSTGEGFASGSGSGSKEATFLMFGVDWCPHCVSAKPEFEKLDATQTIGETVVTRKVVNPEKEPEAAKGYQVEGYPTIILEKDGQQIKYEGPRKTDDFQKFLQENLA
jgi:thioredoxin-like negative regulator of GroEL